jgi:2'-phosphotransferase
MHEESGIGIEHLHFLQDCFIREISKKGIETIGYYVAKYVGPIDNTFKYDEEELSEVGWYEYNDAYKILKDSRRKSLVTAFEQIQLSNKKFETFIEFTTKYGIDVNTYMYKPKKIVKNDDRRLVSISKTLSWCLRHGIAKLGLNMDSEGYVRLDDIMVHPEVDLKGATIEEVQSVVDNNDKKRFSMITKGTVLMIRANQGHSENVGSMIDNSKLLTKIIVPLEKCIHGTTYKALRQIKISGLNKMSRTHIHCAISEPHDLAVVSGARSNSNVLIYVDMAKAMHDGYEFYLSDNGVILSSGKNNDGIIPCEYFEKVVTK